MHKTWVKPAAAIAALNGDQSWLAPRNAIYQERRDIIVSTLQALGLKPRKPLAGLYVWVQVPQPYDSLSFTRALLEKQGVAVSPGAMYGAGGERHIRISVTAPTPKVREAMSRLHAFCELPDELSEKANKTRTTKVCHCERSLRTDARHRRNLQLPD